MKGFPKYSENFPPKLFSTESSCIHSMLQIHMDNGHLHADDYDDDINNDDEDMDDDLNIPNLIYSMFPDTWTSAWVSPCWSP